MNYKTNKIMRILVACEESQAVTKELRKLGHEAFSCDLLPCSGGHPEWHFQEDVLDIIKGWFNCNNVTANDNFDLRLDVWSGNEEFEYKGDKIRQIGWYWDMLIAFPPCTYLTVTGNRWNNVDVYGEKAKQRLKDRELGAKFFMKMVNAPIEKIAIENPIGLMSTRYRKPDQIIHPYMFGDEFSKSTCLWLKNLPLLYHNDKPNLFDSEVTHVGKGEFVTFDSGKRMAKWYAEARGDGHTRSKTFPGIAKAMAEQWTNKIN